MTDKRTSAVRIDIEPPGDIQPAFFGNEFSDDDLAEAFEDDEPVVSLRDGGEQLFRLAKQHHSEPGPKTFRETSHDD